MLSNDGEYLMCVLSVTPMHPAKAVGRNEMLFGREYLCGPK